MPLGLAARTRAAAPAAVTRAAAAEPHRADVPRSHWPPILFARTARKHRPGLSGLLPGLRPPCGHRPHALRAGEDKSWPSGSRPYARLLRSAISRSPSLALTEGAALRPMERWCATERPGACPERAAELAGVDPVGIYTAGSAATPFCKRATARQPPATRCCGRRRLGRPMEAAVSAAVPGEFFPAPVRFVLTEQ